MNVNEVIVEICKSETQNGEIHPNNHVNLGQSSNDVFPSAIRIVAVEECRGRLLPVLDRLKDTLLDRAKEFRKTFKTGRTHLMDAMPVTLGQELTGYSRQIDLGIERIENALGSVSCP
jgi:fumarate hydratase class II